MNIHCRGNRSWMTGYKKTCPAFGPRIPFPGILRQISCLLFLLSGTSYAQGGLEQLRDETTAYFRHSKGNVLSVQDGVITSDAGAKSGMRKGMRVLIVKEGIPFLHPVTGEPMGRIEITSGKAEVAEARPEESRLALISGSAAPGDKIRIPDTRVKVLFYQDKSVDWNLGESYYQMLKEIGRFELLDTSLISADDSKIMAEAGRQKADVALILSAKTAGRQVVLRQRLLWVEKTFQFADNEATVDEKTLAELHAGGSLFEQSAGTADALLFYDLNFKARFIAAGDVDGSGKQRLIISDGRHLRIYMTGANLQDLYDIKLDISDDLLWLDTADSDSDGKDEILVSAINNDVVTSYIYAFNGTEFSLIWKDNLFLRKLGDALICQGFKRGEGFSGPVFRLLRAGGEFRKGEEIKLPGNVNIYDFAYVNDPSGQKAVLAYDSSGYLNLYNAGNLNVWRSKESYGRPVSTFKKEAPTIMVASGVWSIKDRIYAGNNEVLVVERVPVAGMARGLGYKSSNIKALWWNGVTMEERTLADNISGGIQDYVVSGDRMFVLSSPLFGIKAKNILKGESPFGSILYIYSLKGL